MPNNDSHHHVVKTTEQWQDRAVEYWVVPRGTLCVELTPEKKTKIKIGEGSKYYSQLPYICDGHDMSNYYTKEETDRLLDNLNRMAIQSTDVYDTKDDLPLDGNKLGDVRFVKSTSEQKVDPDVYLWNGSKWIYVGYDFANIDLDRYLTKTEFHSEFDPVRDKVDEMYPKMHTHDNKDVLDRTERPFTIADKDKLDSLHNYDDTEIRELIHETGHVHWNKHILDTITEDKLWTVQDREKFESLHNYDDTELRNRMGVVESKAHTHTNKDILDQTTAPFKTEDKQKLDSLENYDIFIGTDGRYPGVKGLVPAPSALDIGTFLSSDGTWKKAGFDSDFIGATPYMDGEHGLVPAPLMGEQSYFLRGDGTWARVKNGDKYKAGEGIYILSGEVVSDTFPFKVYSKAGHLSQYIIYGNTGGVGDAMTGGVYGVNITVTDGHGNSSNTSIILPEKISLGDYIDYGRQVFVHMRTNVSSLISSVDPSYNWRWAIRPNGSIQFTDIGAYGSNPQVTSLIELEPGITYELYHQCDYSSFANYMNLNVYDTEQNRTRTIHFYDPVGNVPTIIALASNEKYIRLTYEHANAYPYTLIRVKAVETPITLPQIPLFPNSINTINVTNTIKPAEIYVEVAEPSEDDPDDPMSDFTGIIYNDGVLDVTQEDPNNLNELTFHYRDNDDKTLTIPTGTMTPATTTTLGGIIVGEGLSIDENGVLDATGGGTQYEAGVGIDIQQGVSESYHIVEYLESKLSDRSQAIDTGYKKTQNLGMLNIQLKWRLINEPTESVNVVTSHEPGYAPDTGCIAIGARKGDSGMSYFAPCALIFTSAGWGGSASFQYDPNNQDATILRTDVCGWDDDGDISINGEAGPYHIDTGAVWKNIFLFDNAPARIYFCRIFDNDTLVRDLVPCVRDSDNIQGFYDRVGKVFYPNPFDQPTSTDYISGPETGEVVYDFTHESESDPYVITNKGIIDAEYDSQNLELTLTKDDSSLTIPVADTVYTAGDNIIITGEREVFTKLEYIQARGNQNINTHKRIRSGHGKFAADFQFVHQPDSGKNQRHEFIIATEYVGDGMPIGSPIIGMARAGSGGSYGTMAGIVTGTGGAFSWYWINSSTTTNRTNVNVEYFPDTKISINGTNYTPDDWPVINDKELYLFGTSDHKCWAKLYSVKIWDDDVLIFDGIPVKRNSDNEVGIFDKCNNEFFINDLGGGALGFKAGPVESGADPVYGNYVGRTKTISAVSYTLPVASDTTLGGIKVGNNLTIDPVTGVLDATGGGTTYVEGDGIEFGRPILETYQVLDKIRKPSGTTLTTDVMPSGTVDFFCDLKYYKHAGDSFLILCYDGERGSFCYTPAPTASGGWARMWIYTAHQNWYDLYLNGSFASSSPIVAHLRWGNTMSMSFDHTSTSAQNTPGVLPGHNRFKFDSNSDADLYWAKFYENSALVGELIPVIRQSDNVVGLFNTVTETFSTASGLTPGSPTGETIVIYDQSSTQNIPINVKLGDGLQFDANGAIEAIPYVEGDAISIEHPQISSTITHVKWVLLNTRNRSSAGDIVQVGEFELYDTDDQLLTYSSISATFGNGGTPTYGTNQYQQTPDKLIDGDTSLKMCCTNFTTSCLGLEITMELMDSIDIQDIKQYRYITANDMDVRDPVTWDLYVSSDGTDWTLVDRQVDDSTIPTARETSTAYYEITHPTSDDLAISVKYGNGLRLDANGALEVVPGGGLTAGRGIEIDQTSHINDKLGVGLTFDSDDAVTLDETTDLIFNCDYSE